MPASNPTGRQLVALKDQIVNVFNDSHWRELGTLTDTLEMVENHPRLLRSLGWGDKDYEGHVLSMIRNIIEHAPENYEILREFLSRKCPENGESVSSEDSEARRIVFSPLVFKVPKEKLDLNLVSAMMPFDTSMKPVYDTIKAAANATGFDCKRVDDIWDDSTIIQDVFKLIFQSYIVICDFTGKNPNVFYEAGIAHTLGKHVIPITQNQDHIPFDLRHHRYAQYMNNAEGRLVLHEDLKNRLSFLRTKQLVDKLI